MTVVEAEAEDGGGVDVVFFFFSSSVFSICVFSRALQRTQRLRYRTVQNPVVLSLAREKANLRNMHPDVIAQTDKINKGSKHNLVEQKADLVGMLRKRQCDVGRFEAMKISRKTITRDSPGRPHYLITQRRVRRMPTASNICVILKKKFRARSCDDLWLKKGVSF